MIENLEIINFKCFEHLTLDGIGSVNLIGGKNNVGKTAFLEAVELFSISNTPNDLAHLIFKLLSRRQDKIENIELDFIYNTAQHVTISSSSKTCEIKYVSEIKNDDDTLTSDGFKLLIKKDAKYDEKTVSIDKFFIERGRFLILTRDSIKRNTNYISSSKSKEKDIAILFGYLVDLNKEFFLNKSLSLFDEKIISLKQKAVDKGGIILKLSLKDQDTPILLSSLGEGVNRYIAILCAIWASKDGVLLIDEIENGIHFSNYKKLWKIIFKTSIEANCQIFVTTHSKECIAAFNEAQFENTECNTQYFEFYKNLKKNKIDGSRIDKEELQYSLSHNGGIRGE